MESKTNKYILMSLKMLVFLSFIYTAWIMFELKNTIIGILILLSATTFLILNKLEAIDRRLKLLEV